MDPRTIEISNLRVLNDYLNQTIDALLRVQRTGVVPGLSHAPYNAYAKPFWGTQFMSPISQFGALGVDPSAIGLSHSSYYGWPGAAVSATQPMTATLPQTFNIAGAPVVSSDPFLAQRGLSHTSAFGVFQQPNLSALEITRQQQLNQALIARQNVLEAICRSVGLPV